jgi:hypothetical protein
VNADCRTVLKRVVAISAAGGGRRDIAQGAGAVGDPELMGRLLGVAAAFISQGRHAFTPARRFRPPRFSWASGRSRTTATV